MVPGNELLDTLAQAESIHLTKRRLEDLLESHSSSYNSLKTM